MAEKAEKHAPQDLARLIIRRWWLFLLGAALFAIAALFGSVYVPVKYTGTVIFERRSDPAAEQMTRGIDSSGFEPLKLTLKEELAGRVAVGLAVEELHMTDRMPRGPDDQMTMEGQQAKQELVDKVIKDVVVRWEVESDEVDLVSVSFTHWDPVLAEQMPNKLVDNYINLISERMVERLAESREFLDKQVRSFEARMNEVKAERTKFETDRAGMFPDNPGMLRQRIERTIVQIEELRSRKTEAELTLSKLKDRQPPTGESKEQRPTQIVKGPNPERKRLKDQLQNYRNSLDSALTLQHMTEQHPTVQTLRIKIAQLEEQIEKTPKEAVIQTIYGTTDSGSLDLEFQRTQRVVAESTLKVATMGLTRLQGLLTKDQKMMGNYGPVRQQFLDLVDRQKKLEDDAGVWQKRLREVDMALAAEVAKKRTHLIIKQMAQKQFTPSSPDLRLVLGVALLGGLAFGAGLVFLAKVLDRSFTTTDDAVEHFNVPILGVVGEIVTPGQKTWRRFRRWIVAPVVSLIILGILGLSTFNTVLWLNYPEQHKKWRTSRVGFLKGRLTSGRETSR